MTKSWGRALARLRFRTVHNPATRLEKTFPATVFCSIADEVGIAAVLLWATNYTNGGSCWSFERFRSLREKAVDSTLDKIVEKDMRAGSRFDISQLPAKKIVAGLKKIGVVVLVPAAVRDNVRAAVAVAGV